MKREDLLVAVEKLLKMKKIEKILPICFTKRNMEGFLKTLKQKKDRAFCKVRKYLLNLFEFHFVFVGGGSENPAGVHQTQL